MKIIHSIAIFLALSGVAHASSSYGIRTNQEMQAVLSDVQGRFDSFNDAVESLVHDTKSTQYGVYIATTSEPCAYTYNAIRGTGESDGLLTVKLISVKCN